MLELIIKENSMKNNEKVKMVICPFCSDSHPSNKECDCSYGKRGAFPPLSRRIIKK